MRSIQSTDLFSVYRLADAGIDYPDYAAAREVLITASRRHTRIWLIGNGGSASTASHAAHDWNQALGTNSAAPAGFAIALTDSAVRITALSNDHAFQEVFSRQLESLCSPGDLLVAFSVSGSSANLLKACTTADRRGADILSFTGPVPNPLAARSGAHVHVRSRYYGLVESAHLSAVHALADELRPQPLRLSPVVES